MLLSVERRLDRSVVVGVPAGVAVARALADPVGTFSVRPSLVLDDPSRRGESFGIGFAYRPEDRLPVLGGELQLRARGDACEVRLAGRYRWVDDGVFGRGLLIHRELRGHADVVLELIAARLRQ